METLLEEYALDDDEMGLDFLDGTNISDTSKDTAPNNVSDVRLFISNGWEGLRGEEGKGSDRYYVISKLRPSIKLWRAH